MKNLFLALLVLGLGVATPSMAASKNCRLMIHLYFKNGKKKLTMEEISALSHEECRLAAQQRRLDSEGEQALNGEEVKVNVIFGYRDLSVLSDDEAQEQ